eukprot:1761257-Prymnesium_polylepis.1
MAAAATRRGLTAPIGEATAGLRPVQQVEACSTSPRSVEMLLFAAALVRLLLVTLLALPRLRCSARARDAAGRGTVFLSAQR